ncbi:NAD+ synthase [Candidatus Gottesmanbacteria bacterium]|nr:NAD+ synthase [Candidatus Gottesmanbacteria bacterium]
MNDLGPLDWGKTLEEIKLFIKKIVQETDRPRFVIGLSGGVDSTVAATLAVQAIGEKNVFPHLLPYGAFNQSGEKYASEVISWLHIPYENVCRIDIQPIVDEYVSTDPSVDRVRKGNVMARVRMMCLFDQAKMRNALVLGTENKTEHLLGYFTRFGDEASDVELLLNFYKTQIQKLAQYLGIPSAIIAIHPTAGLWEGQTDETEFGFSYEDADRILFQLHDKKKTEKEIIPSGFSPDIVKKVLLRYKANQFKHLTPYTFVPSS